MKKEPTETFRIENLFIEEWKKKYVGETYFRGSFDRKMIKEFIDCNPVYSDDVIRAYAREWLKDDGEFPTKKRHQAGWFFKFFHNHMPTKWNCKECGHWFSGSVLKETHLKECNGREKLDEKELNSDIKELIKSINFKSS